MNVLKIPSLTYLIKVYNAIQMDEIALHVPDLVCVKLVLYLSKLGYQL